MWGGLIPPWQGRRRGESGDNRQRRQGRGEIQELNTENLRPPERSGAGPRFQGGGGGVIRCLHF